MTHPRKRRALALLPFAAVTVLALVVLAAGFAGVARATDSMQGMDMSTPMPTATATAAASGTTSGSGDMSNMSAADMAKMPSAQTGDKGAAMDPNMDMSGGSINWFVIGGVIVLIVGATGAAVVTKRRLRRRAASGELADAGVQDV